MVEKAEAGERSATRTASRIDGSWLIETQWRPDEAGSGLAHVTSLYVVVPKRVDACWYRLGADGFRDPLHYGSRVSREFDPRSAISAASDWRDAPVLDRGDSYWLCLSRAAGPASQADAARQWLQARFAGLRVCAEVTCC